MFSRDYFSLVEDDVESIGSSETLDEEFMNTMLGDPSKEEDILASMVLT
jgi:hypothetical protein